MTYKYHAHDAFYDIESVDDAFTYAMFNPEVNVANVFILWGEDQLEPLSKDQRDFIKQRILEINPKLKAQKTTINIINGVSDLMENLIPLFASELNHSSVQYGQLMNLKNAYTQEPLTKNPYVDNAGNIDTSIHTYQFGFNSKAYDMGMTAYVIDQWLNHEIPMYDSDFAETNSFITPHNIKKISDALIAANYPNQVPELSFRSGAGHILKAMTTSTRWADVRLLLGKSAKLTLGLKRYAAQAGWTILESDLVKGHDSLHAIARKLNEDPLELLADMIAYNMVDVLNTKNLFELPDWQNGFNQHLDMLDRFADKFEGKLYVDSTNSKYIEYVIVPNNGGEPIVLQDNPTIDFTYPSANGDIDILEYAHEHGLPDEVYAFYDNYRHTYGKNGLSPIEVAQDKMKHDPRLEKAREEGRLSEKGTSLDMWVTDVNGNANNSHINVSIGGAHGEYADHQEFLEVQAQLNDYQYQQDLMVSYFDEIGKKELAELPSDATDKEKDKAVRNARLVVSRMIKDDDATVLDVIPGPLSDDMHLIPLQKLVTMNSKRISRKKLPVVDLKPGSYVKTIFGKQVIHADVDSLYPSLLTLLKTLIGHDGVDVYGELRNERLKLKNSLPESKADYTEADNAVNRKQLLNKLLLNSATGAADANFKTNILVSNKITSMRIIGNILIYLLSIELASIGATLVSINTDGLYAYGITEAEADKVINKWKAFFQLSASPEVIDRFVSKDTNNRLEVTNNKIQYAGGSSFSAYKKPSMSKSVAKPAIMDESLVQYLSYDNDPLSEFDAAKVKQYLQYRIASSKTLEEKAATLLQFQWIFTGSPSKNRFYYVYNTVHDSYQALGNISRAFILDPQYSNEQIKLLSVSKSVGSNDPVAYNLIKQDQIELTTDGTHLITPAEQATDDIISEIKDLKKSKTDIAEWFNEHQAQLANAVQTMRISPSAYAPLALLGDFKEFTKFYTDAYKNTMTGTNSSIIRAGFIASQRVTEDMRFEVHNEDLHSLAKSDILNKLDLDKYVDLIHDEWSIWAEREINLF